MHRYVTYRRVSTEDQGKSGLGLEAQTRDIALYLDTYSPEPWEVIGQFIEIESGANGDRPELRKAIDLAKKVGATLLVSKLDRLSRKVSFIASLMDDPKLSFRVASMPYADKFQLHIYAALAEQERDFISKRTKAALREAKARGQKLGGLRDKTMKRNEVLKANANARAKKLEGIVLPLKEANASLRDIAEALNSAGLETPRGGLWHPTSVARLLGRLDQIG
ncbi:recombinase family protein [Microvirga sp. CF3016]|uniref:recombinase family protein n=1 Tax=Microvirga sp. CF3016 TaxID=3110181 RepID=UPI002E793D1A|nr:recombinase family protein [Microvirga sp. CF3016]MEE1612725.1 recombinase family protein [Microvirga sp. CF3016]